MGKPEDIGTVEFTIFQRREQKNAAFLDLKSSSDLLKKNALKIEDIGNYEIGQRVDIKLTLNATLTQKNAIGLGIAQFRVIKRSQAEIEGDEGDKINSLQLGFHRMLKGAIIERYNSDCITVDKAKLGDYTLEMSLTAHIEIYADILADDPAQETID